MGDSKVVTSPGLRTASARESRSIGVVLIDSGRLKIQDVEPILRLQREENLRFGEAAIRLGLLTQEDIDFAVSRQFDFPYLTPGQSAVSTEVVAAYEPASPQVEALRGLRSQLILRWFDAGPANKALTVVSAERKEGRSFIAANLAVVFSQLGERTLLIDADLRNPRQHQLFGLDGQVGLSTVLSERAGLEALQGIPSLPNLSVLPAGALAPNPAELLARPFLPMLLQQLSHTFDVILLDSSASSETSDAQILSVRAGAALIVARKNAARTWRVQGITAQVTEARATIVGAVLNSY
jgi:receptor protein-tyrosine kinase